MKANPQSQQELTSFGYGFLGVLIFRLTLPATRIAVSGFDPVFVGLGRAIVAAGLSFNVEEILDRFDINAIIRLIRPSL